MLISSRLEDYLSKVSSGVIKASKSDGLFGYPYVVKDNFCTKDFSTTSGSKFLHNFHPCYNSFVVERIETHLGCFLIGKANLDEFGCGGLGKNSAFGEIVNPFQLKKSGEKCCVGGSSSGSAAMVSADCVPFAIGSDTGGSTALPAALCRIIGFRPSNGVVSRHGLIPLANNLDTAGILSKDIYYIRKIFNSLAYPDARDGTLEYIDGDPLQKPLENYKKHAVNVKVLYPNNLNHILDSEIQQEFVEFLTKVENKGVNVQKINIEGFEYLNELYECLVAVDFASNMSKMNSIAFGGYKDLKPDENIFEKINESRANLLGDKVKSRIIVGKALGIQDSTLYSKALLIVKNFEKYFNELMTIDYSSNIFTILILPGSPKKKISYEEEVEESILNSLTILAPLARVPVISVPIKGGINVQFLTKRYHDFPLIDIVEDKFGDILELKHD